MKEPDVTLKGQNQRRSSLLIGTMAVVALMMQACGGRTSDSWTGDLLADALPPEAVEQLDSISGLSPHDPSSVFLSDGRSLKEVDDLLGSGPLTPTRSSDPTTAHDRKARIINTMLKVGNSLVHRQMYQIVAGADVGSEPAHNGLAYVFGGRKIGIGPIWDRLAPVGGCRGYHKLVGFDCSGLMQSLLESAGITISYPSNVRWSQAQGDPSNWHLPASWGLAVVRRYPKVPEDFQTGDIIIWENHIAIVDSGGQTIINSHGYGEGSPKKGRTLEEECRLNWSPKPGEREVRGVRRISLSDALSKSYFRAPSHIVRLEPVDQEGAFLDTFDSLNPHWLGGKLETTPNGQKIFGRFSKGGPILNLTDLVSHAKATIQFDLHIIHTWDGSGPNGPDEVIVTTDGVQAFRHTFANTAGDVQSYPVNGSPAGTGSVSNNSLGYSAVYTGFISTTYRISMVVPHTKSSLSIGFAGGSSLEPIANESWGIDNLSVSLE